MGENTWEILEKFHKLHAKKHSLKIIVHNDEFIEEQHTILVANDLFWQHTLLKTSYLWHCIVGLNALLDRVMGVFVSN